MGVEIAVQGQASNFLGLRDPCTLHSRPGELLATQQAPAPFCNNWHV